MVQTQIQSTPRTIPLELPINICLQVTDAQLEGLAAANKDLRLEKTAAGELIVNPPTGGESGKRNFNLTGQLYRWHEDHENLGEAFDSSTGFILPNGAIRSPDLSWVRKDRWNSLTTEERKTFPNICPDFVVELRSHSDNLQTLQDKMREYINNGAKLGWLIDPRNRRVEIYRQGQAVEVIENPAEIFGEDILPKFALKFKGIWA